ncbi:uncharacterized protein MYCFIDRAFT_210680 [Pseudocercospora fijiensis CIRAD86]|uniref:Uncharacterized protein n=1 Tax=Pseudocercospora fijiensis (strain CIRAD86) TaxID=383855 RepID=M3AR10_PSEFD|nr:uncharacterized protein MYCFIDRAFT_210680 [Pseudocercospora fijiensis CIRAD86]EME87061.1 hypothetical protein MYCFIDRAFT_210680 [Pseudocercospora fijiensis CIRAD86]
MQLPLLALAVFGLSSAAPLANPEAEPAPVPVQLPASQNTQVQIINLQATIVNLADDIVKTNQGKAKNDYNTASTQLTNIGNIVKTPTSYQCPPPTSNGRITTAENALIALNTTQNQLSTLSLHLQDPNSSNKLINSDFCSASSNLQSINHYITSILGTPSNGPSNQPIAQSLTSSGSGYDETKLGETYQSSLVSLEALLAALNITGKSQQSRDAFSKAESALETYRQAANPGVGSCPMIKFGGVETRQQAVEFVKRVERLVQEVYADTRARNGEAHGDFCWIDGYMTAVGGFVGA